MEFLSRLQFLLPHFLLEKMTEKNYMQFYSIFKSNTQYWEKTQNRPATEQDCLETALYCPNNYNKDKVYCLGISKETKPIAVISLLEDYPMSSVLYIGLLLIDENSQRKGIGSIIMSVILKASKGLFDSIQLSVQKNNLGALQFWEKQGFIIDEVAINIETDNLPMRKIII